ncbi:hypothetical protein BDW75DRAFT_203160 [Aspergillus navahoensis]
MFHLTGSCSLRFSVTLWPTLFSLEPGPSHACFLSVCTTLHRFAPHSPVRPTSVESTVAVPVQFSSPRGWF